MKLAVIRNRKDHSAALARIEELFDAPRNSEAGKELEVLTVLVAEYEERTFPMDLPDPITAIKFRMDQEGLAPKDLVPYIGSASKVSEILSGRRGLGLRMIRNLVEGLAIPAEVLIGPSPVPAMKPRRKLQKV